MRDTRSPAEPSHRADLSHEGEAERLGENDDGGSYSGLLIGLALFSLVLLVPGPAGLGVEGQRVAAVAVLMATWWMTEAIPLPATALLPIPLFPLLGVMSTGDATAPYANHLIFLFLGGFLLALAMQRWGLHRRIALGVVAWVGTEPRQMVFGFMIATAFLSMWISNTATVVMMLPIGIAILSLLDTEAADSLGTPLMLGIAYASSIGGVATLIGTPPNAILAAAADELLGRSIGFAEWMYLGVPVAVVMLLATWLLLVRVLFPFRGDSGGVAAGEVIRRERIGLGRMSRGESIVAVVFAMTAAGWLLRDPKEIGGITIPGIATYMPMVTDSAIAIAGAIALFAVPVSLRHRTFALNWEWAEKLPWGVLLLFGGGLSLARGFETSGLAAWIGRQVTGFASLPMLGLIAIVALLFVLLTELTSNTATATMSMPIMAGVAAGIGAEPLALMAAAALASSMAFMLPVATPPNAIVFGSGRVSITQMVRAGIWLNLVAVALITIAIYFAVGTGFGAGP